MLIRNSRLVLLMILSATAAISGCGLAADNEQAQKVAEGFYTALKSGDAAAAAGMCVTDDTMTVAAWTDLFERNLNTVGKVTAFEKGSGFNVSKSNGSSTVNLSYTITYEFGKSVDSLTLFDNGSGFKVMKYAPELKEARYLEEMAKAQQIVQDYMNSLLRGDSETALSFVGYSGTEKHSKDEWLQDYATINASAGNISAWQIDQSASLSYLNVDHSESGKGNVYDVYVNTTRANGKFSEEIVVFQPAFGQPLKVVSHDMVYD